MAFKVYRCEKCSQVFPTEKCPVCDGPIERRPLTTEEHIGRMTDVQVRYIFQSGWWEQGTRKAREICLAEYDKRIGLENWPTHISKELE